MLTKQDAKNLADKILSYSKLPECRVTIFSSENVFIRFANNGITTSGYTLTHSISISATAFPCSASRAMSSSCHMRCVA